MKHTIICITMTAVFLAAGGCRKKSASATELYQKTFSPVYQEFDIASLVEPQSMHTRDHQEQGSWNTATLQGNLIYSAVLPVTEKSGTPQMILQTIESFIKSKTQQIEIEGDFPDRLKGDEEQIYTLFMYNWQNRHGKLHVWLFPYPDGKHIGFATHHYEENLK